MTAYSGALTSNRWGNPTDSVLDANSFPVLPQYRLPGQLRSAGLAAQSRRRSPASQQRNTPPMILNTMDPSKE